MTNQELERRLEQALARLAPDDLEGVLSRCETRKGVVIPMTKKNKSWTRNLIAACLALVLVGGTSAFYQQSYAVASVISLDVNPSIELQVNRQEKVLSCDGLNEEAAQILADMDGGADLEGTKLDVAVNAIVGSLVRHGYLDSISSAILISVEDKDQSRAARLQQELTSAVDVVLQAQASNAAVLSQTVAKDGQLEQQAKNSNITTGKAALVNQVLAINSKLDFDALAGLSVEELRDLIKTGAPQMPVGRTAAWEAVVQYAGVENGDISSFEVDPELDETRPHYDVELNHPTLGEFEYKVDAYTGQVYSGRESIQKAEQAPTQSGGQTSADAGSVRQYITQASAKAVALAHAGLTESQVSWQKVELDEDDSRAHYDVEFYVGGVEYDYEIGALDGAVWTVDVEQEKTPAASVPADSEPIPAPTTSQPASSADQSGDIGGEQAKSAALAHAGLTASQVSWLKAERDWDNGRLEYEVEFKANGLEYEYTIDGVTGAVLEHEVDRND